MKDFLISFNAVAPMFVLISVGYLIKIKKMISQDTLNQINAVCFYVFLGTMTFYNVYRNDMSDWNSSQTVALFSFCGAGLLLLFVIGMLLAPRLAKDYRQQAIIAQTFFRGNLLIVGYPIARSLYSDIGIIVLLFALLIPLNNILGTYTFERFRNGNVNMWGMAKAIAKNPFIIGTAIALLLRTLQIGLPHFIESAVDSLSAVGSGLALVLLGAYFSFHSAKANRCMIAKACLIRLVLVPLIMVLIAIAYGFRNLSLLSVLIIFACPSATPVFTMAQQMGADTQYGGEVVVFTTLMSCLTLFSWVFLLKFFALI